MTLPSINKHLAEDTVRLEEHAADILETAQESYIQGAHVASKEFFKNCLNERKMKFDRSGRIFECHEVGRDGIRL